MIIGTAGHIDHGKTALVRALTGVDTDRLAEEKARGISIDLGFAYVAGPDGVRLGFVDVPGHEKLVRNMLAGATGIDFVLLVVAADDGVMPQTREHLAIVDLLGVARGVVALTKVDLVSGERRAAAAAETREVLRGTALADADIVPVSAVTGEGIAALSAKLLAAAGTVDARPAHGRFRLAVDRCFSLPGAGTIVTGPVMSGTVAVGDTVVVSPAGLEARVRSIHAQNRPATRGAAGERCALNLVGEGVTRHAITRGAVVLDPALHAPTQRIDATLRVLASERKALAHWTPLRLHHAAADVAARAALLEAQPIAPGGAGRVQLVLDRPIAAAVGDRFVIRDTSGARTIGGGRFLDLRPPQRRRRTPERLAQLDALGHEDPRAALAAALERRPFFVNVTAFARDRALDERETEALLAAVPHVALADGGARVALSPAAWERLAVDCRAALEAAHRAHPERPGLTAAQLAAAAGTKLPHTLFASAVRALVAAGTLLSEGGALRLPGHRLALDERDRRTWSRIAPLISDAERFRPPRASDIAARLRLPAADVRRVLKALARQRVVVEVGLDRFFKGETVEELERIVVALAREQPDGRFAVWQFRDRLGNGRKVAIEILEHFDGRGLTLREGDLRRLNPRRLDLLAPPLDSAAHGAP
ncbi:MAG TPA: selenocysteine-specific translation elongation factor [Gammaproteobacteria bacterium]